jgi:hypothetical protein
MIPNKPIGGGEAQSGGVRFHTYVHISISLMALSMGEIPQFMRVK